ncbi:hypothetical protein [Pelagibius sp. Alg239-R121]|uniref:hypothetical protein n=1 Tax=Pelagibius sp. Alg239-R121 TaxID=2993448 RepID=UPI0024A62D82|nr:hypothetical protein [Pelagibius sp. Alg239-R121]
MRLTGAVTQQDEEYYLQALALLGERSAPFGLISVIDINSGEVSPETRRAQALWFKRNRDHLARLCFGLVRVRPKIDPNQNDDNFVRAMPFPTQRIPQEDQAIPILVNCLEAHEQSSKQAEIS